jgi:hypothetical protein
MMELANTLLTVCRGTEANAYGDESDVGTVLYTSIPAGVVEASKTVFDPATQRPQTIRLSKCIVPSWADILTSDTLQDQSTGDYYMITDLQLQPSLGSPPDKLLTLRWRSGVTIGSD